MTKTLYKTAPRLPVSWGELIDKVTILEIKSERILTGEALLNVRKELSLLAAACAPELMSDPSVSNLKGRLRTVNEELWEIEDAIREKERRKDFDVQFIELARSISRRNDERAAIKKEINAVLNSEIIEEKSYKPY